MSTILQFCSSGNGAFTPFCLRREGAWGIPNNPSIHKSTDLALVRSRSPLFAPKKFGLCFTICHFASSCLAFGTGYLGRTSLWLVLVASTAVGDGNELCGARSSLGELNFGHA